MRVETTSAVAGLVMLVWQSDWVRGVALVESLVRAYITHVKATRKSDALKNGDTAHGDTRCA